MLSSQCLSHSTSSRVVAAPAVEQLCRQVIQQVATEFALDVDELTAPTRRSSQVAFARQVAMYLAHVGFALSFEAVGRVFGRDRTTVAHACRVVEDGRDDPGLDRRLALLELDCRDGRSNRGGTQ